MAEKKNLTKAPDQSADKKAEKKAEKKPAQKKPNWFVKTFTGIRKWCHELRIELKKVVWPSREQVTHDTTTVMAVVMLVGACIWVFDLLSTGVVRALINLFAA